MKEEKLRVVVLEDNPQRLKEIKRILPAYMDIVSEKPSEKAKELLRPDVSGKLPDLVLLNANDRAGQSLSLFEWLRVSESGLNYAKIPVLVMIDDEFSDLAGDFLEIADTSFYEGEPDENTLYTAIIDVIDKFEFLDERVVPETYSEEKLPDKISGHSVKPQGESEDTKKRSMILPLGEQQEVLVKALQKTVSRSKELNELIQLAKEVEKRTEEEQWHNLAEETDRIQEQELSMEQKLNLLHNPLFDNIIINLANSFGEVLRPPVGEYLNALPKGILKKILLVDNDPVNVKLCSLFLKSQYEVIHVDSSIKAISYFILEKADLAMISYKMPDNDGGSIMRSIRWQKNGKDLPVIFMVERTEKEKLGIIEQRGVSVLEKPMTKAMLLEAVERIMK